jgi:hypothetical protein
MSMHCYGLHKYFLAANINICMKLYVKIVAYNLISLKLSCVNWMNKEQGKRDEHTDDLCSVRLAAFLFLFLLILRE